MTTPEIGRIRQRYESLLGQVPESIERRFDLARRSARETSLIAIEDLREELIRNNPLGQKTQQLVHFGQLLALGRLDPAKLHARACIQAGATLEELIGVVETALITSGMPSYSAGLEIIYELFPTDVDK